MSEEDPPAKRPGRPELAATTPLHRPQLSTLDILRRLGVDQPATAAVAPPSADAPKLGRFSLKKQLGRGGMGEVLEGYDPELLRAVAIKVMTNPRLDTAHQTARFIGEAQITGQLDHPNIVPIHELSASDGGDVFFVMKKVDGITLEDAIRAHHRSDPAWTRYRLLRAFVQVCDGVAYAHDRGVLHRDLKPANIMLGDFGEVLVMDWGLARLRGDTTEATSGNAIERIGFSRTQDGVAIGTPGYMSPEQATGQLDKLDDRSDVWSLGAVLYYMLAGSNAYQGTNALKLMTDAAKGPPDPPSKRAPDLEIHDELERICLRALATERQDRFETARALGAAVDSWLEGSQRRREAEVRRRRDLRIATIAFLIVGATAAAMFALWQRAEEARDEAVAARVEADAARASAETSAAIAEARSLTLEGRSFEATALLRPHIETREARLALTDLAAWPGTEFTLTDRCDDAVHGKPFALASGSPRLARICDGSVQIVDTQTGVVVSRWPLGRQTTRFENVVWDASEDHIAVQGFTDAFLMDPGTGERESLTPSGHRLMGIAPLEDGRWLARTGVRGAAILRPDASPEPIGHPASILDHGADDLLVLGDPDGAVHVIDSRSGKTRRVLPPGPSGGQAPLGTLDGGRLLARALAGSPPAFEVTALPEGSSRTVDVPDLVTRAAAAARTDRIAIAAATGGLRIHRLSDLEYLGGARDAGAAVALRFDPTGTFVEAALAERSILLDATSGRVRASRRTVPWEPPKVRTRGTLNNADPRRADGVSVRPRADGHLIISALRSDGLRSDVPVDERGDRKRNESLVSAFPVGDGDRLLLLLGSHSGPGIHETHRVLLVERASGRTTREIQLPPAWSFVNVPTSRIGDTLPLIGSVRGGEPRREVGIWDLRTGEQLSPPTPTPGASFKAEVAADGTSYWTSMNEKDEVLLHRFDPAGPMLHAPLRLPNGAHCLRGVSDRGLLVTGPDGRVSLLDPATGDVKWAIVLDGETSRCSVATMGQGRVLVAGTSLASLAPETGDVLWRRPVGPRDTPTRFHLSPDGKRALLLSIGSSTGLLIDTLSGASVARLELKEPIKYDGVAFSDDGVRVAVVAGNSAVHVWNAKTGERLRTHEGEVVSGAVVVDGDDLTVVVGWPLHLRTLDASIPDPDRLLLETGAATNYRPCRGTRTVVPVVPFPAADTLWAPEELCD